MKNFNSYRKLFRLFDDGTVFCALDTETTGLHPKTDRVIEIGAVKFDKNGEIGRFSVLINPEMSLPQVIIDLCNLNDEMLKNEKKFKEIVGGFLDFTKDTVLIAHNANFDIGFLNAELERAKLPELKNTYIDTLALTRWAYPLNEHWKQTYLAKQFEIEVEAAHRAYDDARVCKEIFLRTIRDTMSVQKQ